MKAQRWTEHKLSGVVHGRKLECAVENHQTCSDGLPSLGRRTCKHGFLLYVGLCFEPHKISTVHRLWIVEFPAAVQSPYNAWFRCDPYLSFPPITTIILIVNQQCHPEWLQVSLVEAVAVAEEGLQRGEVPPCEALLRHRQQPKSAFCPLVPISQLLVSGGPTLDQVDAPCLSLSILLSRRFRIPLYITTMVRKFIPFSTTVLIRLSWLVETITRKKFQLNPFFTAIVSSDKGLPARLNMELIRQLQFHVEPAIFTPRAVYDGRKNMFARRELPLGPSNSREVVLLLFCVTSVSHLSHSLMSVCPILGLNLEAEVPRSTKYDSPK